MAGEAHDAKATFVKSIQRAEEHLREGQYGACASKASEMARFSCMLEHRSWVFVSEILESMFGNMYHPSTCHDLPAKDEKSIRQKLARFASDVLHPMANEDDDKILPLMQLRFDATELQKKVWTGQPKIRKDAN